MRYNNYHKRDKTKGIHNNDIKNIIMGVKTELHYRQPVQSIERYIDFSYIEESGLTKSDLLLALWRQSKSDVLHYPKDEAIIRNTISDNLSADYRNYVIHLALILLRR